MIRRNVCRVSVHCYFSGCPLLRNHSYQTSWAPIFFASDKLLPFPSGFFCVDSRKQERRQRDGWWYNRKWGLAASHSKASKEARLVGRKVCLFWLLATEEIGEGRLLSKGQFPTLTIRGQKLLQAQGGGYMKKQYSQLWQSSSNWSSVVWPVSSWLF